MWIGPHNGGHWLSRQQKTTIPVMPKSHPPLVPLIFSVLAMLLPAWAAAQTAGAPGEPDPSGLRVEAATAWQACVGQPDNERLACFDRWAREQDALLAAIAAKLHSAETTPVHGATPGAQAAVVRGTVAAALAAAQPPRVQDEGQPSGSAGIVGVGLEQLWAAR
jgi:hypothetical protein